MAQATDFLLNGEPHRAITSPAITVLDYLRLQAGKRGSKEGCAEGDCGACTVVLGSEESGRMRYRAVNSCILFVPELAGKLLLTVEGLKSTDGDLHPVQQAMVEHHASQCGYCTPGFVMSLFALHHRAGPLADDQLHEALAGNLCRCTGYRPILDAARAVCGQAADRFAEEESQLAARLRALPVEDDRARQGGIAAASDAAPAAQYFAPRTLAELCALRQRHPKAHLLAGGTDLGLLVTKQQRDLGDLISLNRVAELRRIERRPHEIEIGAAVTYADALPAIEAEYPAFGRLIRRLGCEQVRNLGTIGGNVANASPIGDTPPCLLALDTQAVICSSAGERVLPLAEFFLDYRRTALAPDEILRALRLPLPRPAERFAAYKVSKRFDQDISAVCAAFRLGIEGGVVRTARLAYGGMAAIPKRALAAEAALLGRPFDWTSLADATRALEADFTPLDDFRASAAYRLKVAQNLLQRFLQETIAPERPLEVLAL